MRYARWKPGIQEAYLGIDSGSTTTKIILLNSDKEILFTHYASNNGNPILAVKEGLISLQNQCTANSVILHITGSCVTGYGEELIKAAFGLDEGIIETVAHYMGRPPAERAGIFYPRHRRAGYESDIRRQRHTHTHGAQ